MNAHRHSATARNLALVLVAGAALAADLWDLDHPAESYTEVLTGALDLPAPLTDDPPRAFAVRPELVHRWRTVLFSDPGLPSYAFLLKLLFTAVTLGAAGGGGGTGG